MPPPPEGSVEAQAITTIANRLEPRLRRAFLDAVGEVRDATALQAIVNALERSDPRAALDAVPWRDVGEASLRSDFLNVWRTGFEAAGSAAAEQIILPPAAPPPSLPGQPGAPSGPPRRFTFEVLNPRPLRFLERHGAELVVEISEPTRMALRTSLTQMARQGWSTYTTAKDLMQHIGLTERLARANINYRAKLLEQGLSPARIDRMVAAHAKRLLLYRATTIAITESKYATGNGQEISWRDAVARRLLDPAVATVMWETAANEMVCPICAPMHRQTRTLAQLFAGDWFLAGDGRLVLMPGETHPRCLCARSLLPRGISTGRLSDVVRTRVRQRQAEGVEVAA